ncbi:MAG: hypothetical protein NWF09_04590 [Candidatus Bathyarchaeota archaeon]|nr:hypothetical protein [Candidatus Bathyarchaeota archaeon]
MPTESIDTFFACTLLVSVALLAMASLAGTMQARINNLPDLNKNDYLNAIAEYIITNSGTPEDWGASSTVPSVFGLSRNGSLFLYEVDIDKISRLNSQSSYALSYVQVLNATRLRNIALGISVSQILSIDVALAKIEPSESVTDYTFTIAVRHASGPVNATLQCYVVAGAFTSKAYNTTSGTGLGYVSVQIPNSASGPALLVVFARAAFDDRITSYAAYSFTHLWQEQLANSAFLTLNPLNYTLSVVYNFPNVTVTNAYAFSYNYQTNLTAASSASYAIPNWVDKSPLVLVVCGYNDTTPFIEWVAYPNVPFDFGANFANAEKNVFSYVVTIKETFYKLTISFGDVKG